jgi:hypothetical protein
MLEIQSLVPFLKWIYLFQSIICVLNYRLVCLLLVCHLCITRVSLVCRLCVVACVMFVYLLVYGSYYRFQNTTTPPHSPNHALIGSSVCVDGLSSDRIHSIFYIRITGQIKGLKCMVITVRWFRKNWGCRSVMKSVICCLFWHGVSLSCRMIQR